jgi:hypothetical protein
VVYQQAGPIKLKMRQKYLQGDSLPYKPY